MSLIKKMELQSMCLLCFVAHLHVCHMNLQQARTAPSQLDTHQTSTSVQTPENGPNTKRQKVNGNRSPEIGGNGE